MYSVHRYMTFVLLSALLGGCSNSSTSSTGPEHTVRTSEQQVTDAIAEYSLLTDREKMGEKGDKIIARLKAIEGGLSDETRKKMNAILASQNILKMGASMENPGVNVTTGKQAESPKLDIPDLKIGEFPKIDFPKVDFPKFPDLKSKVDFPKVDFPVVPDLKGKLDFPKIDIPKDFPKVDFPKIEIPKDLPIPLEPKK